MRAVLSRRRHVPVALVARCRSVADLGRGCEDRPVSFARVDDYRAALRMHRSWTVTILLFVMGAIAALPVLILATWLGVLPHMPVALRWAVDFLIAAALVWVEAAYRLAGERLKSQP